MVATVGTAASQESSREISLAGKGLVFGVVTVVLLQAMAYLWFMHLRARRQQEEDSKLKIMVCRCPFCNRKIGYAVVKIGTGAMCPRCKTAFILPEDGLPEDAMERDPG
jgi:hypothetical protein